MSSDFSNLTEEERAFLQQRVALFGKVLTVINGLALIVQMPTSFNDPSALLEPHMAWLLAGTVASAAIWLACRRGSRSALFVRAIEAAGVLAYTMALLIMARYLLLLIVPKYTTGPDLTSPPSLLMEVATTAAQLHMGALMALAFTQVMVVRAALVPTSPLYSGALTTTVGATFIAVTAYGIPGLSPETLLSRHSPENFGPLALGHYSVWWGFTVLVCVVISKVVFGLRQQIREAQQLGQYLLEDELGEGGMGIVYRARHQLLRRPTAVKLLLPDKAGATSVERFAREVRLTALLTHPNTVTIFDYGHTPSGVFYYAMELLDGASLETVVDVAGPMPPARVVRVLRQVLGALHEAHSVGLIHRDIKPANIMLCTSGAERDVAKVLDFGLVKDMKQDNEVSLTATNVITGTPQYMSPEMITRPAEIDARADIYSLGAVAYFLLTGNHVFEAGTVVEMCSHHLHSIPPPPSERAETAMPSELDKLVLDCLEKDPDERPQTAREARERLERCDLATHWTQSQAREWWREYGAACRDAGASPTVENKPSRYTVAVDMRKRD